MASRTQYDDDREDIPKLARRCWDEYMAATEEQRKKEKESAGMWIGGKHQWREGEYESRTSKNRPALTVNRCEPIVAQVENEARQNPPGPKAYPVGEGADADGADILEGLIREYEYRSDAATAYITCLRTAAARMRGAFKLITEYVSDRSMEQQLSIREVPNPELLFYDPTATRPCREDSMWMGEITVLSRDQVEAQYGKDLKIFDRSLVDRVSGWMSDVVGWRNDATSKYQWTGGNTSQDGPYYICEFWRVEIKRVKLTLHSDHILRFDDEAVPDGVEPQQDEDGEPVERWVPRRTIKKYLVTALDVLDETTWPGDIIPIFWVMGPEMWMDKKCYRHSLLSGAIDSQRGLNYAATSAAEIVGSLTKSPWIGHVGQFSVENSQGINPWENSNGQLWSYMEINPTWATDPVSGQSQLLPPPQRNTWEAPIARVLELASFFTEQIKAATSVFFEPSLPSAQKAQSGSAIRALQAQTNIGTLNWQDNLHRAVGLSYQQAAIVMRSIYDSERVRTIVKPDSSHEIATINAEFTEADKSQGKRKRNNITQGQYSIRVTAGPNFQTRAEKSIENLTEVFKIVPQLLTMPGVAAQFLRMMGEGNPQIEQMADALMPGGAENADNPQAMQASLAKALGENQQLKQAMQVMQQAIQTKLPEIEAKKWIAGLNALAGIREAEIKAGVDMAGNDASMLEHLTGLAHDAGQQAADHEHQQGMQQAQQAHATATQASDQQAAAQSQDSAQQAASQQAQASPGDE